MTTSPPSTPQQKPEERVLSNDRAASIGWFFIESYYEFYNKNTDSIYKIYHPDASISHTKFPSDPSESKTIFKAYGSEAIKTRFANESSKNYRNKIFITSADFEVCLKDKILIVVCGEWSKNESRWWQFTQTFLLTPGKKENSFDVANDILTFVELEETKEPPVIINDEEIINGNQETEISSAETSTKAQADVIPNGTSKSTDTDPKTNSSSKTSDEVTEKKIPESDVEKTFTDSDMKSKKSEENVQDSDPAKEEQEQEQQEETTTAISQQEPQKTEDLSEVDYVEKSKNASEIPVFEKKSQSVQDLEESNQNQEQISDSENATNSSGAPISWAALASQAAPVRPVASKPAVAQNKVSPPPPLPAKKAATTSVAPPQNFKYKKEDWFPIYIRGVKQLDEKQLKDHLSKKFGGIKFFKPNGNIALCDFFSEEAQKKALEAKETTIDDVTIQLEHRESKTTPANQNGGKKFKDQKEKVNGETKRGRNEKKQNGKKNRSSSS